MNEWRKYPEFIHTWHCICSWRSKPREIEKKNNPLAFERMGFSLEWKSLARSPRKNTNEELCWRKIFSRLGYCIKFAPLSFMTFEKYHNIMPFLSFYYVVLFITPTTIVLAGASSADAMVVVVVVVLVLLWLSRVRAQWKLNPFFVTSFFFRCNNVARSILKFWALLLLFSWRRFFLSLWGVWTSSDPAFKLHQTLDAISSSFD